MSIARNLHVVFEPAGNVAGVAVNYKPVLSHLVEWRMGTGKIALNASTLREGTVAVQSGSRRGLLTGRKKTRKK